MSEDFIKKDGSPGYTTLSLAFGMMAVSAIYSGISNVFKNIDYNDKYGSEIKSLNDNLENKKLEVIHETGPDTGKFTATAGCDETAIGRKFHAVSTQNPADVALYHACTTKAGGVNLMKITP